MTKTLQLCYCMYSLYCLLPACLAIGAVPPANIMLNISSQSSKHFLESAPSQNAVMSVCDIMRFGAIAGNNTVDAPANAAALRTALAHCQHVVIPSGKVFKISPVVIPSNRILELQEGTALANPNHRFTHA